MVIETAMAKIKAATNEGEFISAALYVFRGLNESERQDLMLKIGATEPKLVRG